MTLDEALAELGLGTVPASAEARRAYLRAVRAHPPERDPEGFRRVREAYELVTDSLPIELVGASSSEAPSVDMPDPEPIEAPAADTLAVAESIELLDDLEPGSEVAIEAARLLVEKHADSDWARWQLLEQYDLAGRELEARKLLLDSYREGYTEFLEALIARFPNALEVGELLAQAESSAVLRNSIARAFVFRGDPVRAARLMRRSLKEATNGESPPPDPYFVVTTLASLIARDKSKSAAKLVAAFRAWLAEQRGGQGADARWVLVRELWEVRGEIDESLVRAMAAALALDEVDGDYPDVVLYRASYPRRARLAAKRLAGKAPNLYRVFASAFQKEPEWTGFRPSLRGATPMFAIVFAVVALNLLRWCAESVALVR